MKTVSFPADVRHDQPATVCEALVYIVNVEIARYFPANSEGEFEKGKHT